MATAHLRANVDSLLVVQPLPWRLDRVLISGTLVTLGFGALSLGAVLPSAMFIMRSSATALFVVWVAAQLVQGKLTLVPSPVYVPALVFAALVVAQISFNLSSYQHDTVVELLNYTCYGLLAFVMLQAMSSADAGKLLSYCFGCFGLAVAVFALLQCFTSNGKVFWTIAIRADAAFFGPYVNHNHYAGLMEMLIAFPLVSALQSSLNVPTRLFFGFSAIIMGVSVVESGSRGGVIAIVCQIVLLAFLGRFTKMKRGAALVLLLVLIAMTILLALVADSEVMSRIATLRDPGRADVAGWRMQLNRDSLAMVRARPILGWGLGAFPTVYPQFRSFYDDVPILQAHDDYLQLLVETGLVGGFITLWFLFVTFRQGWRNLAKTQDTWSRVVTTAAIISVGGLLIHSASDFNLHIPANAALFFVMCAIAVAPTARQQTRSSNGLRGTLMPIEPVAAEPTAIEGFPPKLRVVVRRF